MPPIVLPIIFCTLESLPLERKTSIWTGFRLGATAAWPLSEHWALRSEYRFARVSGRHRGWFQTLNQHDVLLGVQYAF